MKLASKNLLEILGEGLPVADEFVSLLIASGASKRSAKILVDLRGLDGGAPRSLRSVADKLSAERVRQLVVELEAGPLVTMLATGGVALVGFKIRLTEYIRRIELHAPGSDFDIQSALAVDFDALHIAPSSVLRLADILGIHHTLRLTTWAARGKFVDHERLKLASLGDKVKLETIFAIVPSGMPENFGNFINFARRHSRGAGVVSSNQLSLRYTDERGIALSPKEATAFLRPFAVHLGRHDGDDWFAFFNSANDFIRKASTRVELFKHGSFESICIFHERFNRSMYSNDESTVPETVLRAALELAGFEVVGDDIRPMAPLAGQNGRGISEIQILMVKVFRSLLESSGGKQSVRRNELINAMLVAGIRESTARVYLGNQGLFSCRGGQCQLADGGELTNSVNARHRGRRIAAAATVSS